MHLAMKLRILWFEVKGILVILMKSYYIRLQEFDASFFFFIGHFWGTFWHWTCVSHFALFFISILLPNSFFTRFGLDSFNLVNPGLCKFKKILYYMTFIFKCFFFFSYLYWKEDGNYIFKFLLYLWVMILNYTFEDQIIQCNPFCYI